MRLKPLLSFVLVPLAAVPAYEAVAAETAGAWHHFQRQAADAMQQLTAARPAGEAASEAPPVELVFAQLFAPVGERGLEYSAALAERAGQRVSMSGYMVRVAERAPGLFILVPRPLRLESGGSGELADLPPTAVYVRLDPTMADHSVGFRPGVVRVTGVLELGVACERDGRNSTLRLQLDADASAAWLQASHES